MVVLLKVRSLYSHEYQNVVSSGNLVLLWGFRSFLRVSSWCQVFYEETPHMPAGAACRAKFRLQGFRVSGFPKPYTPNP